MTADASSPLTIPDERDLGAQLATLIALVEQRNEPTKGGRFGRRLVQRAVSRILRGRDARQQQVDVALVASLVAQQSGFSVYERALSDVSAGIVETTAQFNEFASLIYKTLEQHVEWMTSIKEQAEDGYDAAFELRGRTKEFDAAFGAMSEGLSGLVEHVHRLNQHVDQHEAFRREFHAVPYMSNPSEFSTIDAAGRPTLGYRTTRTVKSGYLAFEDLFRGSEELIRQRQLGYLPVLEGHGPVLDVGCGRGELLDLLVGVGIPSIGLDLDPDMVRRARDHGHEVVEGEASTYLASAPDRTVGAIFSAQFVEHLNYETLLKFLKESYRVLRDDGLLIMETPNPYSIAAFHTFWTDLTHHVPVFPEVLLTLTRDAGFAEATVRFPIGSGSLEEDRWREGEYAVIAYKQPQAGG